MIDILIVDDHNIFIEALTALLHESGEIRVTATALNSSDVFALMEQGVDADLLVMDVSMPGMDGIETLAELRRRRLTLPVLMLTQESSGAIIARAMKTGASGFVMKTAGRDEFLEAIRVVAAGGEYLSQEARNALIAYATGRRSENESVILTRREREVLKLIVAGRTTNEIAEQLFISPYTAETHRRNLLQKLDLRNTAGLVRYAIEHGLIDE